MNIKNKLITNNETKKKTKWNTIIKENTHKICYFLPRNKTKNVICQLDNAALKMMFSNSQKIEIAAYGFKITRICV